MNSFAFAALFVFFSAVSGAPAALQDACADVRRSSLELNLYAKTAAAQARNQSTDLADFSSSLAWMEGEDMCDPGSLKQKSTPCVGKMLSVLMSYNSALEIISGFKCCSEFARNVKPAVDKLQKDMSKCVKSLGGRKHEEDFGIPEEHTQPSGDWKQPILCRLTLQRLFSFSILAARVFALGDPARHAQGSAEKCT